jgi:glycosyltransferase involved in cell wall biosynthesis
MSGCESELLHACHLIHGLGVGGAEQVLVDLARCGRQAGLRLSVVSMVDDSNPVQAHALRDLGVDVRSLSLRTRWDPRAFRRAAVHLDTLRPDVVHTHMKHADLVGAAIARRRDIPMVSTLHVIEDAPTAVGRVKRRLAAQSRTQVAARVIAVSDAQRRWYVESYPGAADSVVTIPNGASIPPPPDGATRAALRASLGVPASAVLALSVSVMRPEKGLADLLAAAAVLPDDSPLSIALVGDGEERTRLEAIAADPRISSRVRFAGWRSDAAALMHVADLVVHPSHADALPTALVLALGAGVPIVATHTGGIPEIVSADVGVLVPPRNPAQLAAALSELASATDVRQRMGAAARRRFAERFDARSWSRRLASLYHEVLDERTHR